MKELKINSLGEQSILLEWPESCTPKLLRDLLGLESRLRKDIPEIKETQVVYRSICLHLERPIEEEVYHRIQKSIEGYTSKPLVKRKRWSIPVCYNEDFGPDLTECARELGTSVEELIAQHCQWAYPVYGIGFLPGFLYLGDVPESLQLPRRSEPRMKVPAGTVGLAGMQTGIYPQTSPGGWQLLGRTPIKLFDPTQDPPCAIQVGDEVQFYAIDEPNFALFEIQIQEGIYKPKFEELP